MTSTPPPNIVQPQISPEDDEIDLRQVAAAIGRQKKLIGCFISGAVLVSGWHALSLKPVW